MSSTCSRPSQRNCTLHSKSSFYLKSEPNPRTLNPTSTTHAPVLFPHAQSVHSPRSNKCKADSESSDTGIPSIDPSCATTPSIPFPSHPKQPFRYDDIRKYCGLPEFGMVGQNRRKFAHLKREVIDALRKNLANGTLMIYDPPCPGCTKRRHPFEGNFCIGLTGSPEGRCFNCTIRGGRGCLLDDSVTDPPNEQSILGKRTRSNKPPQRPGATKKKSDALPSSDAPAYTHMVRSGYSRDGTRRGPAPRITKRVRVEIPRTPAKRASPSNQYRHQVGIVRASLRAVAHEFKLMQHKLLALEDATERLWHWDGSEDINMNEEDEHDDGTGKGKGKAKDRRSGKGKSKRKDQDDDEYEDEDELPKKYSLS